MGKDRRPFPSNLLPEEIGAPRFFCPLSSVPWIATLRRMDTQTFSAVEACLGSHRLGIGAAELHGTVVGYLCAGGDAQSERWCEALTLEALANAMQDDADTARGMQDFFRRARAELLDSDMRFEPLLPDVERSVAERANALLDWCRGYLGGIGLAPAGAALPWSIDAREILGDFARIAASPPLGNGDDQDEDEADLMELLEYVRVGVLLLQAELGTGGPAARAH